MNRLNIECGGVYAVGDIHGVYGSITDAVSKYNIENSVMICCGDCGLGFCSIEYTKDILNPINDILTENNVHVVMFRGNHDDPSFFDGEIIKFTNIHPVPDYTVLNDSILLVGGATSIDRMYRIKKKKAEMDMYMLYNWSNEHEARANTRNYYWSDEAPVFNKGALDELSECGISIKHICTHTSPSFCEPVTKDGLSDFFEADSWLSDDIDNERHVMDSIWNELRAGGHEIKTWTYGHYHRHHSEVIDGVKFTMLDAVIERGDMPDWIELTDR